MPFSPFVLLDDSLSPDNDCYLFENPVDIVRCDAPGNIDAALGRIDEATAGGLYAAGFLSYELGYLFEPRLVPLLPPRRSQPLLWMGLFAHRERLRSAQAAEWVRRRISSGYTLSRLRLSMNKQAYLGAFRQVLDYIAAGDVYQINLTLKYYFDVTGDPLALYHDLRRKQRVAYGGIAAAGDFHVLSLSPELYLRRDGDVVQVRPMKGTAPRALTLADDERMKAWLAGDAKSRAENVMIVDLLRNDLGRIARIGSVQVTDLFTVETYRTVHQMTSGITARLQHGIGFRDMLAKLFPCGSITGAPKIRAMEIIRELETQPRGVYTGAFGMVEPSGNACFNVAIRTLMVRADGRGEMGIGSGVVQDSDGEAEFDECLLKAHFLTRPYPRFQLIETMRWTADGGYYLFDRHLARLAASAEYFGFSCNPGAVRARLDRLARGMTGRGARVRLLLDDDGTITISTTPLDPPASGRVWGYMLSHRRIDSRDVFVYHKTTQRGLYDSEFARLHASTGCNEVLFRNERGELTEGSRTTLFIERDGRLFTPALGCGLLDGTLRRELLEDERRPVEETVLRPEDLATADRVFLGNSVQGLVQAFAAAPVGAFTDDFFALSRQ